MDDQNIREEEVFAAALALPVWERAAYLASVCGAEGALHARLTALLSIVEGGKVPRGLPFGIHAELVGDRIANYQLLEELGEGGCGIVYRAEQRAPIRREVALKIIKLGMDTRAVLSRFETERQALALMDHPNIAKVLDVGATESGRPYFVMELVRGISITDYCNQVRQTIRERVTLFMQVCQAIHHAHSNGIIHRDIKPSNVLITLVDGAAVVKVIDFGIAKAIHGRLAQETLLTATEQLVGTPAYLSPEQTQIAGTRVDARSDVYSLGVLLYQLLTDSLPLEIDTAAPAGQANLRERIRNEEPMAPSKRIGQLPIDVVEMATAKRRLRRAELTREIRGDLDCIVMCCLEKEPLRRYQTANELFCDLERYLHHEPIAARARPMVYRVFKVVRRHRVAVAAMVAIVAVLGVAMPVITPMVFRLTQAARLTRNLDNYLGSIALAKDARDVSAHVRRRKPLPPRELEVDRSTPARASIHQTLAAFYRSLGDFENDRLHMNAALSIYQEKGNQDRIIGVKTAWATWLAQEGRYVEAEATGRSVLEEAYERYRQVDPPFATIMGYVYLRRGKYAEARGLLEPILERMRPTDIAQGYVEEALDVMKVLAMVYVMDGEQMRAERLARTVLLNYERRYGPSFSEVFRAKYVLADVYAQGGKFGEAAGVLVEAVYRQSEKRMWWKNCDCARQPRPAVDPVRPMQSEVFVVMGILDLSVAPLPSPLTGCRCEPVNLDHPWRINDKAPLVFSD